MSVSGGGHGTQQAPEGSPGGRQVSGKENVGPWDSLVLCSAFLFRHLRKRRAR